MVDDSSRSRAKDPHASADEGPFGFIVELLQNLGKFCEPESSGMLEAQPKAVPVDRVVPTTEAISESSSGGFPEKTPRRFLDESPTLPPDDGSAETTTPVDTNFVPYIKPGLKIVMPSEARKRRSSLTPIAGSTTPRSSFEMNISQEASSGSRSSVPTTGQFMMMDRRGSSHSVNSAHSHHSQTSSHSSQTPRSTPAIAEPEETVSYVHRRRQSYTEAMKEKSLGSRFLKATGHDTPRGTHVHA